MEWNIQAVENVFRVCIAWYKHERGWENSRQLCKPETNSRVCTTVENSANSSSVYIRLCKHRKKVFYCFYKITFPRKKRKTLCMALIKREILTSCKILSTKSCSRNRPFALRGHVTSFLWKWKLWFCLQKMISGSYSKQNKSDLVFQTCTVVLKWVSL